MRGPQVGADQFADWEARAGEPEIQALIRGASRRGEIRVRPTSQGGIRIIPNREAWSTLDHETGIARLEG
jgi:hypothetical protein